MDANPEMVRQHGFCSLYLDASGLDLLVSILGWLSHAWMHVTEIWLFAVLLLVVAGCSLDFLIQVALGIVVEP
jgi:hypothetical protein